MITLSGNFIDIVTTSSFEFAENTALLDLTTGAVPLIAPLVTGIRSDE
jgi:hypothetical protein